jgi:ABC-type nitrate/sulfonate/bicarbonate transport system substrate-binding protein
VTDPVPLRVITFVRYPALEVAEARREFAAEGLSVSVEVTPSSLVQMQGLAAGHWDVAVTSFDNLLVSATREGVRSVAFGVADAADLPLFVRPEIGGYEDLRGRPVAADSVDTAFALVLRRLLLAHDLDLGRGDFELVAVGANAERLASMRRGDTVAAILAPPWDTEARAAGLRQLGHHREVLPAYPGQMLAATAAWLGRRANREAAVGFVRAWLRAAAWSADPANRHKAVPLLEERIGITRAAASALLDGAITDIAVTPEAVAAVRDVRLALGLLVAPGPPLDQFFDPSIEADARGTLGTGGLDGPAPATRSSGAGEGPASYRVSR